VGPNVEGAQTNSAGPGKQENEGKLPGGILPAVSGSVKSWAARTQLVQGNKRTRGSNRRDPTCGVGLGEVLGGSGK